MEPYSGLSWILGWSSALSPWGSPPGRTSWQLVVDTTRLLWQEAEYHPLYWHQNKTIILSFTKDKWWPSLFPEGEKSLNPFVHQNMLFLHGTRLSCPPCNSPRSPREQKWNPTSHDITYHSAFLLLQSSQRRLHQESLSHNAAQAAASDQRATGIYRDIQGP